MFRLELWHEIAARPLYKNIKTVQNAIKIVRETSDQTNSKVSWKVTAFSEQMCYIVPQKSVAVKRMTLMRKSQIQYPNNKSYL